MSEELVETPESWERLFLEAYLGEYGTITKAARAAGVSPKTVQARAKASPAFRARLDAARDVLKDTVRYEILRRALEPSERPVFQRGVLVGVIQEWDNKHLQWVAERMIPEEFHIPTRIEVAGEGEGTVNFKLQLSDKAIEADSDDGD